MEPRISVITLGVSDLERAYHFYKEGLGFPTSMTPDKGIVFFQTNGTRLSIYPRDRLAEDVSPEFDGTVAHKFSGVTLAHCTRTKEEVEELLIKAEKAGGKIEKPAQDAFWGGYHGYFSDPDGYLWEVVWFEAWKFNPDGSLVVE